MTRPVASGALLLTIAALLFGLMAVLAKRASVRLPGPEIALIRFGVGLVACGAVATRLRLHAHNWTGLFWRGAFGGAAVLCYFLGIAHLPVGVATLLTYTAPVFTALWAWLFLDESLGPSKLGALALTTLGVALVISGNASQGSLGLGRWQLVGILSAVLSGAAVATIREVRRTDGSWEIFATFCIGGAVITGVPAARGWIMPTAVEWVITIAAGALSVGGQILLTYSLRYVRATVAGIITQLTPVSALALGWLIYGEQVLPLAMIGATVTLAGVTWGALMAATPDPVPIDEP